MLWNQTRLTRLQKVTNTLCCLSGQREIATFISPNGLYSYNVMPFGLWKAPATFQLHLKGWRGDLKVLCCRFDDVMLYSNTGNLTWNTLSSFFLIWQRRESQWTSLSVSLRRLPWSSGRQGRVNHIDAKVTAVKRYSVLTGKKRAYVLPWLCWLL